ncbi:hypothetical protein [Streptomyces formicae]|uniref:Uncharacterized protein n=1 Tax=Streptomyces formicae TaxID=1616117 RepID=A0ABY3WKR9_9ACTN|nr:hypothetical protein [Streptomyces formicae]UNM13214.1 hypothetical protein J4032_18490 [Streptomyces formicae]
MAPTELPAESHCRCQVRDLSAVLYMRNTCGRRTADLRWTPWSCPPAVLAGVVLHGHEAGSAACHDITGAVVEGGVKHTAAVSLVDQRGEAKEAASFAVTPDGITEMLGFLGNSELVIDRIGIEGSSSLGQPLTLALSAAG